MLSFDNNYENRFQNACTQGPTAFLRKRKTEFDIRLRLNVDPCNEPQFDNYLLRKIQNKQK